MDQTTARKLAKLMSDEGNGLIYVALTNYSIVGEYDKADAEWGVAAFGFGGQKLISEVPAEFTDSLAAYLEEKVDPMRLAPTNLIYYNGRWRRITSMIIQKGEIRVWLGNNSTHVVLTDPEYPVRR